MEKADQISLPSHRALQSRGLGKETLTLTGAARASKDDRIEWITYGYSNADENNIRKGHTSVISSKC